MKKKIVTLLITAALLLATGLSASAAETITFRGQAEKFVTSVDGDVETFTDMLPGETRTVSLTLKNEDSSENGQPFFTTIIGGGTAQNTSAGE